MYNPQATVDQRKSIDKKTAPLDNSLKTTATRNTNSTTKSDSSEDQVSIDMKVSNIYSPDLTASAKNFKDFIKSFQPLAGKKSEVHERYVGIRKSAFKACDIKRSGRLSMPEIETFVRLKLKQDHGAKLGDKIFNAFLPSYEIAYNATKDFKRHISQEDGDYICFQHFRILNVYLCVYAGMLEAFSRIIGYGDRSQGVSQDQWTEGREKLRGTGFIALEQRYEDDAGFDGMKSNGKGYFKFGDFCEWIKGAEISANTELGGQFGISKKKATAGEVLHDDASVTSDISSVAKVALKALMTETKRHSEKLRSLRMHSRHSFVASGANNGILQKSTEMSLKKMASEIRSEQNYSQRKVENQSEDKREDVDPTTRNRGTKHIISTSSALVVDDMVSTFRVPSTQTRFLKDIRALSEAARLSLQDFSDHLQILNKNALDEEGKLDSNWRCCYTAIYYSFLTNLMTNRIQHHTR
jgi:hypothetical protein